MTYIQITTRCNMKCDHCCFSCGKNGDDMTKKTWRKALSFAVNFGEHISIGGGEPTMHRHFTEFLLDAISESEDDYSGIPFIVTNGKTKHIDLLFKLTRAEVIHCELSQDQFHDPIDPSIVKKFSAINAIRDITNGGTRYAHPKGRAVEEGVYEGDPEDDHGQYCTCSDFLIDPKGNVKPCGCPDAPIICNLHDKDWEYKFDDFQTKYVNVGCDCWHSIKENELTTC